MSVQERYYVTIPNEYREFSTVYRVDPNNGFPVDAEAHVTTESGHKMVFRPRQIGQSALYLLALVSAEPMITDRDVSDKEAWVEEDRIAIDSDFTLGAAFPIFKDNITTFRAKKIVANIDLINISIED